MKYTELKADNEKLKRDLQLANMIIQNAHEELDKLGAPNAKLGAHPGHRVFWYRQELEKRKANIDKELLAEFPDILSAEEEAAWVKKMAKLEDEAGGFPGTSGIVSARMTKAAETHAHKLPILPNE